MKHTNPLAMMVNALRRVESIFPGYFPQAKHDHYKDFGFPDQVGFTQTYQAWSRNGIGHAAVEHTVLKTWETNPVLAETEDPEESRLEKEIRQWADDLRLWQRLAEADRRSLVGGYAGVILRLADGKTFKEPVDNVPGGLAGLVELVPAWEGQLTVSEWDNDETSESYGHPKMFSFKESDVTNVQVSGGSAGQNRAFEVHPDRVVIWSKDGTIHNRSLLEPGFNDLLTIEKVLGAGGEGFWKNAKSTPVLETEKDVSLEDIAKGMGVPVDEIADKMDEQVSDFNKGFDAMLMLQGIKAKTLPVSLPIPEHFFNAPLQSFAASVMIPLKILVGNQTGERASTEDANQWAKTNEARRTNVVRPNIGMLVRRLEQFGILLEKDWVIQWGDLTEANMPEKIERADKMANINQKMGDDPVYTVEEIREVTGHNSKDAPKPRDDEDDDLDDPEDEDNPLEEPGEDE